MTDDFGEQMRNAANAAAARSVRPPVTAVRRRLARRRATTGMSVATVVALAAVAGAGALESRSALQPVATPSPSASAAPAPTESPSPSASPTTPPPPAAPTTIVAARGSESEDRPIAFLAAATGRMMRSIQVDQGDGPLIRPVVSYDRKTIYFARFPTACSPEIVAVPTEGGPETVVAHGFTPAISNDGHRLAFLTPVKDCLDESVLVVKDLRTGTERRWAARAAAGGDVVDIAWAPDSRHLAVIRSLPRKAEDVKPGAGAAGYEYNDLRILDTRAPGMTVDAGHQVPGDWWLIARVTYRGPEGTLLVLGVPSHLDYPSTLTEVDPETGRKKEVVKFPHAVYEYDFDASGEHLIYVWDDTLYRWVAGRSTKIANRVNGADW